MKLRTRSGSDTIAHTRSIGASTCMSAPTLTRNSPEHRQPTLGCERVQRLLHQADDVVVYLIDVRFGSELLAQVDCGQRLDRELGGKGDVAEHVADVESPRQRDRDWQDLQPEQAVE